MDKVDVIVVGGGCAGLSAAYTLRKHGIKVLVFEANDSAGGRCRSVYEDGFTFPMGAVLTEPQWKTTFRYINELGLTGRLYPIKTMRYGFFRKGKVRSLFVGGGILEMLRAIPENLKFLLFGLPWKIYPQLLRLFFKVRDIMRRIDTRTHGFESLADLSDVSSEEFVLAHGGPQALDWIAHPFLASLVLARPGDVSAAHPLALMSLMQGMFSLNGGLGVLTAALYDQLRDAVRLSTPVSEIVITAGRAVGVRTADGFIAADHVICAVDAVSARQLMPGLPGSISEALATCRYSSTFYYQFGLEQSNFGGRADQFGVMIPASARSVLNFVGRGSRPGEKTVIIASTRGWEDGKLAAMSETDRLSLVMNEVRNILPDFPDRPAKTKMFRWDRAINLQSPGQFKAIQNMLARHIDDVAGLYLAGEYLFLIACTEGALMTGEAAAERVLAAIAASAATVH